MRFFSVPLLLFFSARLFAAEPNYDRFGDPLPSGAVARLGGSHLRHPRPATGVAFSPDGKRLAHSDWGGYLYIHSLERGKLVRHIDRMPRWIRSLVFSPNGKFLAVADATEVHIFGVASGREVRILQAKLSATPQLAFAADGKTLAGLDTDSGLHLWDVIASRERLAPEGHTAAISDLVFLPDGRRLVSYGADGRLCLWDIEKRRMLSDSRGHSAYPGSLTASANGKAVRLVGRNQRISNWDLAQDRSSTNAHAPFPLQCAAVSPDGRIMAVCMPDGELQLRQQGQSHPQTLNTPPGKISFLRFSPNSKILAGGTTSGALPLWNRASGAIVRAPFPAKSAIGWLDFSADGRTLLLWSGGRMHLLETATGQERIVFRIGPVSTAHAYSPDGRFAACGGIDGSIHLYAISDGREIAHFQGPDGHVKALAFSTDGRLLASAGDDKTILLWKTPKTKVVKWNAAEAKNLWDDLAIRDGKRAHRALVRLVGSAEQAVPFLHEHLRTHLKPVDVRRIAQLIQDLDDDAFARRQKASRELAKMGEEASAAVNAALQGKPSLEARRRLRTLHERLDKAGPSSEQLRCLRALEALERIGTPKARQALAELSGKDIDATIRQEIRSSLRRLNKRR